MKFKQEIQLEVVKAVVNGELFLEEAMVKYKIKDKRTILEWIKKTKPLLEALKPQADYDTNPLPNIAGKTPSTTDHDTLDLHIWRENTLLQKVVSLQDKVSKLEKTNMQLARHRDLLLERVSLLELRIQVKKKEYPQ